MDIVNKHTMYDLAQMRSLPLEAKITLSKERIRAWYDSWHRYEIINLHTGKSRFVTDTQEPIIKEDEYIESILEGWVYVSFSGGKDSTVLKHLVDSMYADVPSLFVNTGLEYPEIQKFAMNEPNVITIRPKMRFDEVLTQYGYPLATKEQAAFVEECLTTKSEKLRDIRLNGNKWGRGKISKRWKSLLDAPFNVSDKCCDIMKKEPAKRYERETGRKPFIGTMAYESKQRESNWLMYGCNAFNKTRPTSQPLSFWTEQDILEYIKKYNVPYCSVYGEIVETGGLVEMLIGTRPELKTTGCDRTGCIFCMFGCHLEKEPNRFQKLSKTHPRQYEYCIGGGELIEGKWQPNKNGLALGKVLDYIKVPYKPIENSENSSHIPLTNNGNNGIINTLKENDTKLLKETNNGSYKS